MFREENFNQLFNIPIKASTICNKLNRIEQKLLPYYSWIYKQILKAPIIGTDESSMRINAKKGWFWTWQNGEISYIIFSMNRAENNIHDNLFFFRMFNKKSKFLFYRQTLLTSNMTTSSKS